MNVPVVLVLGPEIAAAQLISDGDLSVGEVRSLCHQQAEAYARYLPAAHIEEILGSTAYVLRTKPFGVTGYLRAPPVRTTP